MLPLITPENFENEVLQASGLVLVNFSSAGCGPCQIMDGVLTEWSEKPNLPIKIAKVDVDKEVEFANLYRILIMPTLKIFKNGECVKDVFGLQTREELLTAIEPFMSDTNEH